MEIIVLIIIFLILSTGGIIGAAFFDKKYEDTLPVTHFVLIVIMYFAGLLDVLDWGVKLVCFIAVIGYAISFIWVIKKKQIDKFKASVFTECFWIFLLSFLLLIVLNVGKVAHHWDEFTCWATRVKDMCRLDTLYTVQGAHVPVKAYPPAIALIHYLYEEIQYMIVGEEIFVQWYMFASYQIFMVALLLPILGKVKVKKNAQFYILSVLVLLLPMFFLSYAYNVILVDAIMGVMLGYGFTLLLNKEDTIYDLIVFTLCQITLFLTKDVAVYFCCLMWAYWIIDTLVKNHKKGKYIQKNILAEVIGLLSFFAVRFLWNHNLILNNLVTNDQGSLISKQGEKIDIKAFFGAVFGTIRDDRQSVFLNYCRAFFLGDKKLGSFNFGVSFFFLLIVLIILTVYLNKCYKQDDEKRRQRYLMIGEYFALLGYWGIIMLTMMFIFWKGDADTLNGHNRYINTAFLMIAYTLIAEWVKLKWNGNVNPSIYLMLILCLLIPGEPLVQFIDRQDVFDSQNIEGGYIDDVKKIEEIVGDSSQKICYLNFDMDNYLLYYYKLNYGFNTNQLDLLQEWKKDQLIATTDRSEMLSQYNYILIYNNTDEYRDLLGAEIENTGQEKFELYCVRDLKLVRIV